MSRAGPRSLPHTDEKACRSCARAAARNCSTASRGAGAPVICEREPPPPPPPPLLHAARAIITPAAIVLTFKQFTEFSAVVVGEPNNAWPCQQLTSVYI